MRGPIATGYDLVEELAKTDIVLSSRFHGVSLAHLLHKPVIAVSDHGNIDSLMSNMSQPNDVVPCIDFNGHDVIRIFEAVWDDLPSTKTTLEAQVATYRSTLEHVYDELIGHRVIDTKRSALGYSLPKTQSCP